MAEFRAGAQLAIRPQVAGARVPLSTYRLQFNAHFTFTRASAIVAYLDELGIGDCYASSYLAAVPGSPHGYDVADPTRLNPDLGTDEDYWLWIDALRSRGMTHVKALLVDDLWSVIGTTNLDNRSFEHNDEVNLAVRDQAVTARILADFESDLARSREITLASWRHRPLWEKLFGTVAWILERQQ